MPTPEPEQAVAVLTAIEPNGVTTHVFLEHEDDELAPFHRALQRREALLAEHPAARWTMNINERALDAATVTMMHAAGFTNYSLLDAEQTRQALDDTEDQLGPSWLPALRRRWSR